MSVPKLRRLLCSCLDRAITSVASRAVALSRYLPLATRYRRRVPVPGIAVFFAALFLACLLIPTSTVAQSELAGVYGRVTDQSGAVIVDAEVEVKNVETGLSMTVKTNQDGLYTIPSLHPGHYLISARKPAFKTVTVTQLELNVQDNVVRNFALQVGSIAETVTITADQMNINSTDATVKTVVDQKLIHELPLNGRSFQTLFELTPGVTVAATSFLNQGQFSVNGQRTSANYFTVDGASANVGIAAGFPSGQSFGGSQPALTSSGGTNGLVSVDAVQEFAIQTSSYAAEFGRTPGGQISIATRSGANEFHGTAFDYLRNEAFDANDWFANEKGLKRAALRQNDFGGTFSGPIFRNKTFFFFSYEGLRLLQPTTGLSDVPTVAVRNSAPAAVQPYLKAFPLPTGPDEGDGLAPANYSFSNPTQLDAGSVRVDHHINNALSIFARYNYAPSSTANRGTPFSLNTIQNNNFSVHTLTLGLTYMVTPQVADEMRFNWSKASSAGEFQLDSFGGAVPLRPQAVFPSTVNNSNSQFFLLFLNGNNVFLALGPNVKNRQTQINIVQNISWQRNAHMFKFGLDYRRLTPIFGPASYSQSDFFFGIPSILSSTADITGISSLSTTRGGVSNYSLYAQDTWKVLSRLTITYGLRWDYNPAPVVTGANGLTPAVLQNVDNLSTLSLATSRSPLYRATADNFAPRLGIAYRLRNSSKMEAVVRAGFGIFYDLGNGVVGNVGAFYPFSVAINDFTPQSFPLTPAAAAPPVASNSPPFPPFQAFPHTLRQPYTYHWNLSYEQALGASQTLTLGYVGSGGHSLVRGLDIFSPPLDPAMFQEIRLATNGGYSNYNALQTSFRRRTAKGLNILASYTYAHSLDNASDDQGTNPAGQFVSPRSGYGPSDFDIRHTASAALDYELPSPHGSRFTNAMLDGWGLNTLLTARSSLPIDVTISRLLPFGQYSLRPELVAGQPVYLFGSQCSQAFGMTCPGGKGFNPNAFSDPLAAVQGDFGRNTLRGFPLVQADFSVRRRFRLTDRLGLQARFEVFNLLNHPNFASPSGSLGTEIAPGKVSISPTFGISQSLLNNGLNGGAFAGTGFSSLYQLGGPRSMQLALKLEF